MNKGVSIIKKYKEIFICLAIVGAIALYVWLKVNHVKKDGLVGVAKVTRFEGAESGIHIYIEIYCNDKIYRTSVDQSCEPGFVGNYYFVKFNCNKPSSYPILFCNEKVPDCIISQGGLYKTWKEVPTCQNFKDSNHLAGCK